MVYVCHVVCPSWKYTVVWGAFWIGKYLDVQYLKYSACVYLPMQAVWCWVKPGGHLQVNPPMVLTHKNWQLCCLVEHSSRSEKEKSYNIKSVMNFRESCPDVHIALLRCRGWSCVRSLHVLLYGGGRSFLWVKFQSFYSHWPTNELQMNQTPETRRGTAEGETKAMVNKDKKGSEKLTTMRTLVWTRKQAW